MFYENIMNTDTSIREEDLIVLMEDQFKHLYYICHMFLSTCSYFIEDTHICSNKKALPLKNAVMI